MLKVVKFGGSSLADAAHFQQALNIIKSEPERRFAVPSAPGKRNREDRKITDMLYACHATGDLLLLQEIEKRYREIAEGLGLNISLGSAFAEIAQNLSAGCSRDYMASRGEYLNGLLMANALGVTFIDAADVIVFDEAGRVNTELTRKLIREACLPHERAVIPGFYGRDAQGNVKTFSRGGSDITGALIADALDADVYENWTDVPGVLTTDPRIVPEAKPIEVITYRELRELSYMGATVLHEDAIFPVRRAGIPIHIRDTGAPEKPGTMIVAAPPQGYRPSPITGIAGRKGMSSINIEKAMMNSELGFARRVLQVLEDNGVSIEHMPTGIDTLSVMAESASLEGKLCKITEELHAAVQPDSVEIMERLALIATVGRGMVSSRGTAAKIFTALREARINIRLIDQGSSELNIIIGIDESCFEEAIRAIYRAFCK